MYIIVAGAGMVGVALAERLVEGRHDVVVIEQDKGICEDLAAKLGILAINGSATDIDILEQAGIEKAEVAIGAMRIDADNISFSLLAKSAEVPRVIARMRDPRYASAYKQAGVSATIHVTDVFVNQMLLEIEEPNLRQVATFGGGQACIVMDTIAAESAVVGQSVSEIAAHKNFPEECLITGIYRTDTQSVIFPRGSAILQKGDKVFLVGSPRNLRKLSRMLHKKK